MTVPRPLLYAAVVLAALTLVPLGMFAVSRTSRSTEPRLMVVGDMDTQPKRRAQSADAFFADGRAMRLPVEGTVARGDLREDPGRFAGRVSWEVEGRDLRVLADAKAVLEAPDLGGWIDRFPVVIDAAVMGRGRERFGIYCSPCHGLAGRGDGPVARRAAELGESTWTTPTDLTSDVVAGRPSGHLFNTVSWGIRNMPGYASQIPVDDRWAIVAYVRALQRSVRGTIDDVPADVRPDLQ